MRHVGRPPVIVRDRVASVALEIIDNEGIDSLSIERIATELGVRGPSLYHHYADKAEILGEVARLVLGDLDMDQASDDWREWMVDVTLRFYRRVLEHPGAAAILLEYLPERSTLPGFGRAARLMTEADVDPVAQVLLMEGSEKLAWGWALQRAVMTVHADAGVLSRAAVNGRWPELASALRDNPWTDAALVEASVRAFIDGVVGPKRRRKAAAKR